MGWRGGLPFLFFSRCLMVEGLRGGRGGVGVVGMSWGWGVVFEVGGGGGMRLRGETRFLARRLVRWI